MLCMQLPKLLDIRVTFDNKGHQKFKKGFVDYLKARFPNDDLFPRLTFSYSDSKNNLPLQVADIYAGSIAKQYERVTEDSCAELRQLLAKKATVWEWPRKRDWGRAALNESNSEFDALLRREASQRAWTYLDRESETLDEDTRLRCIF